MYRAFYGLKIKPFQISSDPSFMWLGEKHKEALATLKYGILDNKGFLLLTGDVGTGKTTLINALIESLSDDVICTSVPDPSLEKLDFFNYIGHSFGIQKEFKSKGIFLAYFRNFLINAYDSDKKVLLIVDEAQLLTQELLEEIRLLSNIEKTNTKLINIFFIGQNEFNEILNRKQNRAVRQRLTLNYNIDPLTPEETSEYITHRLTVAGASQPIFDDLARHEIFLYSGGFPRRINVLCDHCLLSGYVQEKKIISQEIVQECARDLRIPKHIKNRDANGYNDRPERMLNEPEPVAQVPVQPPFHKHQMATPPPVRPVQERSKSGIGRWIIFILIVVIFSWFYMFPAHFSTTIRSVQDQFFHARDTVEKNLKVPTENIKTDVAIKTIPPAEPEKSSKAELNKESDQTPVKTDVQSETSEESEKITNSAVEGKMESQQDQPKILPIEKPMESETSELSVLPPKSDLESKKKSKPEPIKVTLNENQLNYQFEIKAQEIKTVKPLPLPKEKTIIRFKYNTNDFTENGYEKLENIANILDTHPDKKIRITGYTDTEGSRNYNLKLSEFRANIISSFLMGRGITQDRLTVIGMGSKNPIESNETSWGRMMNRRVEIDIVD